jgi:acetyl esterase/lipase
VLALLALCGGLWGQASDRNAAGQARRTQRPNQRIQPTAADISYGSHERSVIDFYQAQADKPAPLVLFIHGGGFRSGSKRSMNQQVLRALLAAGISVAAIEYRLVPEYPLPTAHRDCLRALQFLRSKAREWNIDKERVGAFGGSAGAQICMWLAFHDEMAEPRSSDPLKRESSRLSCVATNGGQTTMDFAWWKRWVPGYEEPHRNLAEVFGDISDEQRQDIVKDISALSLISRDDPPIFMSYGMRPEDPVPTDSARAQGWKVHHVIFGVKLKERMDRLGIEADLKYPGAKAKYSTIGSFFITKLRPDGT